MCTAHADVGICRNAAQVDWFDDGDRCDGPAAVPAQHGGFPGGRNLPIPRFVVDDDDVGLFKGMRFGIELLAGPAWLRQTLPRSNQ